MLHCEYHQCPECVISDTPILKDLDGNSKKELYLPLFPSRFPKKQIIALEGNPSQNIYIAKKGEFKAYKTLQSGKHQIVRIYSRGDFIQLNSLYEQYYTETVQTITPAETCTINKPEFESFLERNPHISLKIIKILTRELTLANKAISDLGQKNARSRLAGFLMSWVNVKEHDNKPFTIEIPLSRIEIANILGITQETLIRLFNDLKKGEIIDTFNHTVVVRNIPQLLKIAC